MPVRVALGKWFFLIVLVCFVLFYFLSSVCSGLAEPASGAGATMILQKYNPKMDVAEIGALLESLLLILFGFAYLVVALMGDAPGVRLHPKSTNRRARTANRALNRGGYVAYVPKSL